MENFNKSGIVEKATAGLFENIGHLGCYRRMKNIITITHTLHVQCLAKLRKRLKRQRPIVFFLTVLLLVNFGNACKLFLDFFKQRINLIISGNLQCSVHLFVLQDVVVSELLKIPSYDWYGRIVFEHQVCNLLGIYNFVLKTPILAMNTRISIFKKRRCNVGHIDGFPVRIKLRKHGFRHHVMDHSDVTRLICKDRSCRFEDVVKLRIHLFVNIRMSNTHLNQLRHAVKRLRLRIVTDNVIFICALIAERIGFIKTEALHLLQLLYMLLNLFPLQLLKLFRLLILNLFRLLLLRLSTLLFHLRSPL